MKGRIICSNSKLSNINDVTIIGSNNTIKNCTNITINGSKNMLKYCTDVTVNGSGNTLKKCTGSLALSDGKRSRAVASSGGVAIAGGVITDRAFLDLLAKKIKK